MVAARITSDNRLDNAAIAEENRLDRPRPALKLAVALALVGAISAAFVTYWWLVSKRVHTGTLAWIEQARAHGYGVGYRAIERTGFPLHARVSIADPSLSAPGAAPGWSWTGERAVVEVRLLAPWAVQIGSSGRQKVTFLDGGVRREYQGQLGSARYAYKPGGWLPAGRLRVRDLNLASPANGDGIALSTLEADASGDPQAATAAESVSYRMQVGASGVAPPTVVRLPLAPLIDRVALEIQIKGMLAPSPWPESLSTWRDAGGTIELAGVRLEYGPLAVEGNGTLALDRANQPIGAMSLDVHGLPATLDALQARGMINPATAQSLGLLLGTLAPGADRYHTDAVRIPLTLQDHVLAAGPVPIARLPILSWVRAAQSGP